MKKSTKKAIAIVALLLLAGYGYKSYFHKKSEAKASPKTLPKTSLENIPNEFKTQLDEMGNGTRYWTENGQYFKQVFGPTVRAGQPTKVSQSEFTKQYAN